MLDGRTSRLTLTFVSPVLIYAVVALAVVLVIILSAPLLPVGIDWSGSFRPATLAALSGQSPYAPAYGFFNPPWLLLALAPFAALPEIAGRALWFWFSLAGFAVAAYRLGARRGLLVAFLLSPVVLHSLLNSNIDVLPLLGFTLPPQAGLFLISIKPQMSVPVAIFWFVQAWRKGGWRETVRVFGPFAVVFGVSLILYGAWPLHMQDRLATPHDFNASLWPYSILPGLILLAYALYRCRIRSAIVAGPMVAPFTLFHSYVGLLAALLVRPQIFLLAVGALWAVVLLRLLGL